MNFWSEPSLQDLSAVWLLISQPLHFYDRQGKKNFGSFLTQDRQQTHTQRGKARVPGRPAREWPTRGIQRRAQELAEHRRQRLQIGRASCRKECRSRWSPYH